MDQNSLQRPRLMSRGTWARLSQTKSSGQVLAQPSFSSDVMEPPAPALLSNSFSSRSDLIEPPSHGLLNNSFSSKSDIVEPTAPGLYSNSFSSKCDIVEPPSQVLFRNNSSSKNNIMEPPAQVLLSNSFSSKSDIIEPPAPGLLSNSFDSVIRSIGRDTEPAPSLSQESFQSLYRSKVEDTAPPSLLSQGTLSPSQGTAHASSFIGQNLQSVSLSMMQDRAPGSSLSQNINQSPSKYLIQDSATTCPPSAGPALPLSHISFIAMEKCLVQDTIPDHSLGHGSFQSCHVPPCNRTVVQDTVNAPSPSPSQQIFQSSPSKCLVQNTAHSASLSQKSCQSLGKSLGENPAPAPSISHKSFHSLRRSLVQGAASKALVPDLAPATFLSQQSFQSLGKSPRQDTTVPPSLSQQSFQSARTCLRKKPRLMSGRTFKRLQVELSLSSDISILWPSGELKLDQPGQEELQLDQPGQKKLVEEVVQGTISISVEGHCREGQAHTLSIKECRKKRRSKVRVNRKPDRQGSETFGFSAINNEKSGGEVQTDRSFRELFKKPVKVTQNIRALKEITKYQRSSELLLQKLPFQRLVQEVMELHQPGFRIQSLALAALQEAAEARVVEVLEAASLASRSVGSKNSKFMLTALFSDTGVV